MNLTDDSYSHRGDGDFQETLAELESRQDAGKAMATHTGDAPTGLDLLQAWTAKDADLDNAYRRRMPDATGAACRHAAESIRAETGLDLLQAWIGRDPSNRCVDRMALKNGQAIIELRGAKGVHESTTQCDLDSGIRTALMVAGWAGDR